MNKKQIQNVKNALRKANRQDYIRAQAKRRCHVDAAVHRCENCGVLCYDGKSFTNLTKMFEKYGEIFSITKVTNYRGKQKTSYVGLEIDHVEPVVPPTEGEYDWNLYVPRMFPDTPEGYMGLCAFCHAIKTKMENMERGKDFTDWDDFFEGWCGEEVDSII